MGLSIDEIQKMIKVLNVANAVLDNLESDLKKMKKPYDGELIMNKVSAALTKLHKL
jgi:hypothetical protein